MKVTIKHVNFSRSPALESLVKKKLSSIQNRLEKRKSSLSNVVVNLKLDARAPYGRLKDTEASVKLKVKGISKTFFVSKKDVNIKKAAADCIDKLESQIRRLTEKKESSRRTLGKSKKLLRRGILKA